MHNKLPNCTALQPEQFEGRTSGCDARSESNLQKMSKTSNEYRAKTTTYEGFTSN